MDMLDVVQRVLSPAAAGGAGPQGPAELPTEAVGVDEPPAQAELPTEAVEVGEPQGWASPLMGFHLEGLVDDHPVAAHWEEGSLTVDPVLLARARTVVGLGEAFGGDDDLPAVTAALDGSPLAAFLTLMRACSRVTRAHCGMASGG
ncbi:MAG TPA: hypothetical protein VE152_08480 [Acidimicrobiales bacterium]|nr:hypothetical protein [Acidimicrobiales bacterium]